MSKDKVNKEFQIDLTEDEFKDVENLFNRSGLLAGLLCYSAALPGAKTKKELFFNAIALLDIALEEIVAGNTIASIDEEKRKYKEIVFKSLEK